MSNKLTRNETTKFLEEVFDSVFNGVEFKGNLCSKENRFKTFVSPNGDRIVFCHSDFYQMNRYETSYWCHDEFDENNNNAFSMRETPNRKKTTRVFIYNKLYTMHEIEEYIEDHVWILDNKSMGLWNHRTNQLVKTIDNINHSPHSCNSFVYFMKNGNIANFNSGLCVYDINQNRGEECVLNEPFPFKSGTIKLVTETTENELYFLIKTAKKYEHCLFQLGKEGEVLSQKVNGSSVNHSRWKFLDSVLQENKESGLLENGILKTLRHERDRKMLERFRCFKHETHFGPDTYEIYEWNSDFIFNSGEIEPECNNKSCHIRHLDGFNGLGVDNIDSHAISVEHTWYSEKNETHKNELWLMSKENPRAGYIDKMDLGEENSFNLLFVDASTIVCIPVYSFTSAARVFRIRSR